MGKNAHLHVQDFENTGERHGCSAASSDQMASSPGSQSSQNSCDVCSAPVQINSHQGWTVRNVRNRCGSFVSSDRQAWRVRRQVSLLQVVITGKVAHSVGQAQCLQQSSNVEKHSHFCDSYSPRPERVRARGGTCSKVSTGISVCSAPSETCRRSSDTFCSMCSTSADLNISLFQVRRPCCAALALMARISHEILRGMTKRLITMSEEFVDPPRCARV